MVKNKTNIFEIVIACWRLFFCLFILNVIFLFHSCEIKMLRRLPKQRQLYSVVFGCFSGVKKETIQYQRKGKHPDCLVPQESLERENGRKLHNFFTKLLALTS